MDWILTEGRQFPKAKNKFWKREKLQVIYIAGKKLVPMNMGWKGQRMRVLHKISGGSMDRGHNVIILNRRDTEPKYIKL